MTTELLDCVVIGGGPAGSTTAALVAEQGRSTLLLERDSFPRFHIGESLMPETYWTLERLGVADRVRSGCFVKKNGVQFVNHEGKESKPFYFREADDRDCAETLHVQRDEFDRMLFENAAAKGATCWDRTRVLDVKFSGEGPHTVEYRREGGEVESVRARVVVDATGQPYDEANVAEGDFETMAIAKIKEGESYVDEVSERDGKPVLRAMTAIPVVMEKCVMCHPHYAHAEEGQAIGAVSYIVPIDE